MMATNNVTSGRLAALEAIIERGMKTFVEVGNALLEIRDSRLYRESFATFDEYCRERWKMSRIHAHRMIEAAGVANTLLPIGNVPKNEAQARELAPLPPERQREIAATIDFTKATAKEIHVAVEKASTVAKNGHAAKAVKAAEQSQPRHDSSYLHDKTRLIGKIHAAMGKHPRKCSDLQHAIMKAINATPDAPMEYLRWFFKEMMRRRRETSIIAEKRTWRPDAMVKLDLIKIIDWIEIELHNYISGESAAPEAEQHPNESHKEETQ